ncbi:MAG TPA: hypothetical protein VGD37_03945 [Kofleriaceae bacterium]
MLTVGSAPGKALGDASDAAMHRRIRYNHQKTLSNESTEVLIDHVVVTED